MAQIGPGSQRDHLTEALHHLYGAARWDEGDAVARDVAARLHRDGDWNAELAIAERAAVRLRAGPRGVLVEVLGRAAPAQGRARPGSSPAGPRSAAGTAPGRREGMMVGHGELGILAQDLGHLKTARRHQESVLELSREQADQLRMAASLSQLGNLDVLEARFSDARERYKAAQEIYREIRNEQGVAATLVQMAMVDEALGRVTEAAAGYGRVDQHACVHGGPIQSGPGPAPARQPAGEAGPHRQGDGSMACVDCRGDGDGSLGARRQRIPSDRDDAATQESGPRPDR